jgi:hypothetical protein
MASANSWNFTTTNDPDLACANGITSQTFSSNMKGCWGTVSYANRATLCATGWTVCSATTYISRASGVVPNHHYWTNDSLRYSGQIGNCSVSLTVGNICNPNTAPMRVCKPSLLDTSGNRCNWYNCGYETTTPNYNFGGCDNNLTAGTLCCSN